jgi:bacterioferritin
MVEVSARGTGPVVDVLNDLIAIEMVAVNQYFLHAKIDESRGISRLAKHFRDDSIEEMRDLESLMDRVLYLGGIPNLQYLEGFQVGEAAGEQFELTLGLEARAVEKLQEGISTCVAHGDEGSAELLRSMLTTEEAQLDWVRTQLDLLQAVGEANYLAQQLYP